MAENGEQKWIENLKMKRKAEIQSIKEQADTERRLSKEEKPERFHGAFTGGFSAGYFNTVGSEEGFTPARFVSTRLKKAEKRTAKVLDYMDEEDLEQIVKLGEEDEDEDIALEKPKKVENAKTNPQKAAKLKLNDAKTSTRAFGISILEDYDKHDDPYYRNENFTNYDTEILPSKTPKTTKTKEEEPLKKYYKTEHKTSNIVSKDHSDFSSFIKLFKDKNKKIDQNEEIDQNEKIDKTVFGPVYSAEKSEKRIIGPKKEDFLLNTNVSGLMFEAEKDNNNNAETIVKEEYDFSLRDNFTTGKTINLETIQKGHTGLSYVVKPKDPFEELKSSFSESKAKQNLFHRFLNEKLMFKAIKTSRFDVGLINSNPTDLIDENSLKREFAEKLETFESRTPDHPVLSKRRVHTRPAARPEPASKVARTTSDWLPDRLLSKRFGLPELAPQKVAAEEADLIKTLLSGKSAAETEKTPVLAETARKSENSAENGAVFASNGIGRNSDEGQLRKESGENKDLFDAIFEEASSE